MICRIILDEAALFLSDKSNAISVNLARGKLISMNNWIKKKKKKRLNAAAITVCFWFLQQTMSKWLIWEHWS